MSAADLWQQLIHVSNKYMSAGYPWQQLIHVSSFTHVRRWSCQQLKPRTHQSLEQCKGNTRLAVWLNLWRPTRGSKIVQDIRNKCKFPPSRQHGRQGTIWVGGGGSLAMGGREEMFTQSRIFPNSSPSLLISHFPFSPFMLASPFSIKSFPF